MVTSIKEYILTTIRIMGYWKNVSYDISRGMSREMAERINALRYDKSISDEERKKEQAKAEAEIKLNSLL